jgi:hypothetical protein
MEIYLVEKTDVKTIYNCTSDYNISTRQILAGGSFLVAYVVFMVSLISPIFLARVGR